MIETAITHLLDAAGVPYRRLEHSEPVYTIETAAAQDLIRLARAQLATGG